MAGTESIVASRNCHTKAFSPVINGLKYGLTPAMKKLLNMYMPNDFLPRYEKSDINDDLLSLLPNRKL